MRIPTTEARRNLDTGAGTLSTPRITDAVGQSLRSVGGAVSQLAERYQRQQDADQAVRARKSFLDFQNTVQDDYRASLENAPENGAGLHESWIVGVGEEPGHFDQRAVGFIAGLPESMRAEYMARVEEMRDGYDDRIARDQLEISQGFSNSVITQQMEVSVAAISQNPGTFEDQLEDVQALVVEAGLPVSQAAELLQTSEQQLAMIAARAQMERDPEGLSQALDDHQSRYGQRRIDAAFEAATGEANQDEANAADSQSDAQSPERPIATRANIRSRVDGAFEAVEQAGQGEARQTERNRYDPILQRLDPTQIDDLRFELEDARFEEKRRTDFNAAALRRALGDNLKSIRETGWPAQDIDAREMKGLLGNEEAEKYESDRMVARASYRIASSLDQRPDSEIDDVVMDVMGTSDVEPARAAEARAEGLQQHQARQQQQQDDPARSVEQHAPVQEARAELDVSQRESVSALITVSETAQAADGIPEENRSPIRNSWMQNLSDDLATFLDAAQGRGADPYETMRLSFDVFRDVVGEEHAGRLFLSSLRLMEAPLNRMARAERVIANAEPFDSELAPGALIAPEGLFERFPGLEPTLRNGFDASFGERVRRTFQLAIGELEQMPRASGLAYGSENAWPPFDIPSTSAGGLRGDRARRRDQENDVRRLRSGEPPSGTSFAERFQGDVGDARDGFLNLGSSMSRGGADLASDISRGLATIPNQIHTFRQDRILDRIRNVRDMNPRARATVQRRINWLRHIYPNAQVRAQRAFDAILDGRLQPEALQRDMVFQELPSLEESALMGLADSIDEFSRTHMPNRPGWEDHYTTYIGEFVGGDGPALLMSLNGPYRLARLAFGTTTEVLATRGDIAQRAMDAGASDEAIIDAMTLATLAGIAGAAPIDALIASRDVRRTMWEVVRTIADDGRLEVTQAVSQQVLENLAVQLAHDEDRGLLEGALEAGLDGYAAFIASQILQGATNIRTRRPTGLNGEGNGASE